jgi:hypothetical protein
MGLIVLGRVDGEVLQQFAVFGEDSDVAVGDEQ